MFDRRIMCLLPFWILLTLGTVLGLEQNLVVIMVDGFANYYLNNDKVNLIGFENIANEGVRANYLRPEWPSISYPNWYTVATGLRIEKHGFTGNYMYDKKSGKKFNIGKSPSDYDPHWWTQTTPIWTNAIRQKVPVSCYWWAGCQVPFPEGTVNDVLPYKGNYQDTVKFADRQEEIVAKLKNGTSRFVLVYYELLDAVGHMRGPNHSETTAATREISYMINNFQKALSQEGLWDRTNLVVISDHGMAQVKKEVYIEHCMNMNEIELLVDGYSFQQVFVKNASNEIEVYKDLTNCLPKSVKVYWTNELPENFHYKKGRFLPNIILVADIGYAILSRSKQFPSRTENSTAKGMHGWDNTNDKMQAIFLARGPCFKRKVRHQGINMVDIYQVLLNVLNISPSHPHDGSWQHVSDMFRPCHSNGSKLISLFAVILLVVFIDLFQVLV